MKILVCMKQVPQKDAPLKLNESGTWIREDVSYEVNEPDAYALEEALRQKEKHGGEVVAITSAEAGTAAGLPPGFHQAAAAIYTRVPHPQAESPTSEPSLTTVINALLAEHSPA